MGEPSRRIRLRARSGRAVRVRRAVERESLATEASWRCAGWRSASPRWWPVALRPTDGDRSWRRARFSISASSCKSIFEWMPADFSASSAFEDCRSCLIAGALYWRRQAFAAAHRAGAGPASHGALPCPEHRNIYAADATRGADAGGVAVRPAARAVCEDGIHLLLLPWRSLVLVGVSTWATRGQNGLCADADPVAGRRRGRAEAAQSQARSQRSSVRRLYHLARCRIHRRAGRTLR